MTRIPLTRVPVATPKGMPTIKSNNVVDTTSAKPRKPGIRRYPKGHPMGGKFVPATMSTEEANKLPERETLTAFKGFTRHTDGRIRCRDTFFTVGEEQNIKGRPLTCIRGFHACENPFTVFSYYSLRSTNIFGRVKLLGPIKKSQDKHAAKGIVVEEVFSWPHLLNLLAKYAKENPLDEYIQKFVSLNSNDNIVRDWNLQTKDRYGYGNKNQIDNSTYKLSNVDGAQQYGVNANSVNMAFGHNSRQTGHGWHLSHADHVAITNQGSGLVEVLGKDCTVLQLSTYSPIKATEGTKIMYADPSGRRRAVNAVVGEGNLPPDKYIYLEYRKGDITFVSRT